MFPSPLPKTNAVHLLLLLCLMLDLQCSMISNNDDTSVGFGHRHTSFFRRVRVTIISNDDATKSVSKLVSLPKNQGLFVILCSTDMT